MFCTTRRLLRVRLSLLGAVPVEWSTPAADVVASNFEPDAMTGRERTVGGAGLGTAARVPKHGRSISKSSSQALECFGTRAPSPTPAIPPTMISSDWESSSAVSPLAFSCKIRECYTFTN